MTASLLSWPETRRRFAAVTDASVRAADGASSSDAALISLLAARLSRRAGAGAAPHREKCMPGKFCSVAAPASPACSAQGLSVHTSTTTLNFFVEALAAQPGEIHSLHTSLVIRS